MPLLELALFAGGTIHGAANPEGTNRIYEDMDIFERASTAFRDPWTGGRAIGAMPHTAYTSAIAGIKNPEAWRRGAVEEVTRPTMPWQFEARDDVLDMIQQTQEASQPRGTGRSVSRQTTPKLKNKALRDIFLGNISGEHSIGAIKDIAKGKTRWQERMADSLSKIF